jgi:hypothetical protein
MNKFDMDMIDDDNWDTVYGPKEETQREKLQRQSREFYAHINKKEATYCHGCNRRYHFIYTTGRYHKKQKVGCICPVCGDITLYYGNKINVDGVLVHGLLRDVEVKE